MAKKTTKKAGRVKKDLGQDAHATKGRPSALTVREILDEQIAHRLA